MKEQIEAAIAAHAMWKLKLKAAIDGGQMPDIATVAADNQCQFGKWLYSATHTGPHAAHFAKVKQLHAEFHRATAGVLNELKAGKVKSADAAIAPGTPFFDVSSKLTMALVAWKAAA